MSRSRVFAAAAVALLAVAAAFLFAGPASAALVVPRRALLQGGGVGDVQQTVDKALGGGGNGKAASAPAPAADKSSSSSSSPSPPPAAAAADKSSSPSPPPPSNAQQSKDSKPQDNANQGNKGGNSNASSGGGGGGGNNSNNNNSNNQSKETKAAAPAPEDKKAAAAAPAPQDKKAPAPAPEDKKAAAPAPAPQDKKAPAPAPAAPAPAPAAPAPAPAKAAASSPTPSPAPAPSPAESKDSKDTKEKTPDGKPVPVAPPGKPAGLPPKEVPVGPSGIQPDNGSKDSIVPTDKDAKDNSRGAKAAPVDKIFPGVEVKTDAKEKQEDPSGKGLIVGSVINPESAISASRSSGGQGVEVKQGPAQNFASLFNEAPESSGNIKPELRGVPAWGGGGGSGGGGGGGGSFTGSNYYPINWLNANVYTIPRYTPSGILGWFTGVGSTQSVIIVLDNWEAKVVGWGPTPIYRAPAVGFTFSWGFYEYLWYANTYGSWGWKSPPLSLVMYDNWGNRLQVEVFVTLNLKTWEVWNTKVTNIQFLGGGGWGSGKK